MQISSEWTVIDDVLEDAQSVSTLSHNEESCQHLVDEGTCIIKTECSDQELTKPHLLDLVAEVNRLRRKNYILRKRLNAHLSHCAAPGNGLEFWGFLLGCLASLFSFLSLAENEFATFEWDLVQAILSKSVHPTKRIGFDPTFARVRSVPLRVGGLVGSLYRPNLSHLRAV